MRKKIQNPKDYKRKRRHLHIRTKVVGTANRPRVCIFRSNLHIYVQMIDDESGRTVAAASSLKVKLPKDAAAKTPEADGAKKDKGDKKKRGKKPAAAGAGVLQAREVGRMIAELAKEKGITKVCFDRGGYLYHGRVAALAQAMREGGLEF
jgi:large subunit ribosomal protein L18